MGLEDRSTERRIPHRGREVHGDKSWGFVWGARHNIACADMSCWRVKDAKVGAACGVVAGAATSAAEGAAGANRVTLVVPIEQVAPPVSEPMLVPPDPEGDLPAPVIQPKRRHS